MVYRFCDVYGPGDYHASRIIPGTLYRVLHKREKPMLNVYKDSTGKLQSFYRDMIYIDDLTQAIVLLLKYMETKQNISEIIGEAFNLGTGHTYDMKPVIAKIMQELGSYAAIEENIVEKGEIKQQCMDYVKLKQKFGFEPQYSLDIGLQKTVRWYVEHMEDICEKFI